MSDLSNHVVDEARTRQRLPERERCAECEGVEQRPHTGPSIDSGRLLSYHATRARANSIPRAAALQTMQRTHGNRAVQRFVGPIIPSLKPQQPPSIEDRIMEAMRRLVEAKDGSSGEAGGGAVSEGGGGPLSWLTGAASKAVDWVGKGASKVGKAVGELIPDFTPDTPDTPTPPLPLWKAHGGLNPFMRPDWNPTDSPNGYGSRSIPSWLRDKGGIPRELPFEPAPDTPPYPQPEEDPFNSPWVIH